MKCAIVDSRISEKCKQSLLTRGFRVIETPAAKNLGEAVMCHPDMLMFYHENKIITSAEYCESFPQLFSDIKECAPKITIELTEDKFSPDYPRDAIFNALCVGEYVFLKKGSISTAVMEYAKHRGLKIINTKQGYPACTVLTFGKSAICADLGMAKILKAAGLTVTVISNGDISLPPYDFGFIGGACGVHGGCVYFLGNLDSHRDSKRIKSALKAENYTPVSLSDEPLLDLGRIIFID